MVEINDESIRKTVRDQYGKVAEKARTIRASPTIDVPEGTSNSCCTPPEANGMQQTSSCACGNPSANTEEISSEPRIDTDQGYDMDSKRGYSEAELCSIPDGANLGLGCGNPTGLVSIKEGETVIDLGSGAGVDCFLAANKVGKTGKVIGVDMTSQMLDNARENAKKGNYENVEFRLGEIENLPIADNTADLIISNCVIILSPNKQKVYNEAFRVLKPGGRVMVSDLVLNEEIPPLLKRSLGDHLSGVMMKEGYLETLQNAGFQNVEIVKESYYPIRLRITDESLNEITEKNNLTSDQVEEVRNFKADGLSLEVTAFKPS